MEDSVRRKRKKVKKVGKYHLKDVVGKGAFGVVYKGENPETGEVVAIKTINIKRCPREELKAILTEIDLLKQLQDDTIVKYYDYKKTKKRLHIIFEFMKNGSLQDLLKKKGKLEEEVVRKYINQVLKGINYVHGEGIIHRDIKGANILISDQNEMKLADFGVAGELKKDSPDTQDPAGTPYWMAPEVISFRLPSPKSDIWSIGALAIELLTGKPPYFDLPTFTALYRIVQDESPPIPKNLKCSHACRNFLLSCFERDVAKRPDAETLLKHRWFNADGEVTKAKNKRKRKRRFMETTHDKEYHKKKKKKDKKENKEKKPKKEKPFKPKTPLDTDSDSDTITDTSDEDESYDSDKSKHSSSDSNSLEKIKAGHLDDEIEKEGEALEKQKEIMELFKNIDANSDPHDILDAFKRFFVIYNDPTYFEMFEQVGGISFLVEFVSASETKQTIHQSLEYISKMLKLIVYDKEKTKETLKNGTFEKLITKLTKLGKKMNDESFTNKGKSDDVSNSVEKKIRETVLNIYLSLNQEQMIRKTLWENEGFSFLKYLLEEKKYPITQIKAFSLIFNYLCDENIKKNCEKQLSKNIKSLIKGFQAIKPEILGNSLDIIHKLFCQSKKITSSISSSPEFLGVMKTIFLECKDPFKRNSELKILMLLYKHSKKPKRIIQEMYPLIQETLLHERRVNESTGNNKKKGNLIRKLSEQLIRAFEQHIKM